MERGRKELKEQGEIEKKKVQESELTLLRT